MQLKSYTHYKNSGIAWLGDIPAHWEVKKLKYVINGKLKYGANEPGGDLQIDDPRYIRITDFDKAGKLRTDSFCSLKSELAAPYLLKEGDILFARSGATVGKTFQFKNYSGLACFAGYLIKAEPNPNIILSDFLFQYTNSATYSIWKNFIFNKATIENIGADKYCDLLITLPPIKEQTAIAQFLDYKTEQIDRFIRQKKQLIALLNEQKAVIINDAVTKGLNPNVPMQSSGIEWLGDVPAHWEVKKLKYSVKLNHHKKFDKDESCNNKVALETIESKTGRILTLSPNLFEGIGTIFKKGDVLFGKLRPYLAKVVTPDFEGNCVNEILVLTPSNHIWQSEFLKYKMLSPVFIKLVDDSTYGSKMPRASWDFIGGLHLSCPSKTEQTAIVIHIETATAQLNEAIRTIEKEIALVQEYRTALISEAVTGKIDVRDY